MINHPNRGKGKEPSDWDKALNAYSNALFEFKDLRRELKVLSKDPLILLETIREIEHNFHEANRLADVVMHNTLHASLMPI